MTHDGSVDFKEEYSPSHIPVLCQELSEWIQVPRDGLVVDATIGHGGHSRLFGNYLGPEGKILGLDVDPNCINRAQQTTGRLACQVILVRANFARLPQVMAEQGLSRADLILADLGFCSAQLEDDRRGLSFQTDMPLDMRLDGRLETTAADLVNRLDAESLANLIYQYGEDRASRRIARFIVEARGRQKITSTSQLAEIVRKALHRPGRKTKERIHPATRTFQALRIAVNHELENLEILLQAAPALLKTGGYLAVISFHSLEDRLVKNNFRQNKSDGIYEILTKKPIEAGAGERAANPRSRSAKLRIAQRMYEAGVTRSYSMTADAKVGLLLGLLFIVVIAFLINGPAGFLKADKPVIDNSVPVPNGRTIRIDQAVEEVARDLQAPPIRQVEPPQEVQVLGDFSSQPQVVSVQTTPVQQAIPSPPPPVETQRPSTPAQVLQSHVVQAGENLAVIAIRYYGKDEGNRRATIQKLFERNQNVLESPDTIRVGDKLTIPSVEDLFTPVPVRQAEAQPERSFLGRLQDMFEPAQTSVSSSRYRDYVVQPGDRLWDIAEEYMGDGKRYTELVKLNRRQIKDPDHVPAGITLKIPVR